jgi:mannan polymerase II complex MNN11 subunit
VKTIAIIACAVGAVLFLLSHIFGGGDGVPSGTPPVVIVTVMDTVGYSKEYQESVKENRLQYARKHGKCNDCSGWLHVLCELREKLS